MEYKVIHTSTADLQADLNEAAAEGWELFSDPLEHRTPRSPSVWLCVMERHGDPAAWSSHFHPVSVTPRTSSMCGCARSRVTTAMDAADSLTLATIVAWADRNDDGPMPYAKEHARGYAWAVADVKAILAVHGQPPGTPVHFGEGT